MRIKAVTVQKVAMGAALLAALTWNLAQAGELNGISVSTDAKGTRAELNLGPSGAEYRLLKLAAPYRVVVDLDSTEIKAGTQKNTAGWVTGVRTGLTDTGSRVVLDLAGTASKVRSHMESRDGQRILVLTFPGQGATVAPPKPVTIASAGPVDPAAVLAARSNPRDAELNDLINDLTGKSQPVTSATVTSNAEPVKVMPRVDASASTIAASSQAPTTVATGVPTRRATGVQTALTPAGAAAIRDGRATVAKPVPAPVRTAAPAPRQTGLLSVSQLRGERMDRGDRKLVIAIDPGHGGQDPGARGLHGTREKDITLQIARELARQVNATPGMRAVLTRDADFFIPLPERPRIARRAGADIFISIHADAAENRKADGSSVYVLSTRGATSQRARWLADKENAADMVGGVKLEKASNTLASVLIDLTQSGHMRASEDAADNVLTGLKRIGNIHKHNVEKANFAVLRGSDMPSMLVETAFISNPDEERRLKDPNFQRSVAGAVLDGVHTYFSRLAPPGTIYASLAEDESGAVGGSP